MILITIIGLGLFLQQSDDQSSIKQSQAQSSTENQLNTFDPKKTPPSSNDFPESSLDSFESSNSIEKTVNQPQPQQQNQDQYELSGEGCLQNKLNTQCILTKNQQKILTLKSCQENSDQGCNLYSFSIQKTTQDSIFLFGQFQDDREVKLLDVYEFDKKTQELNLVNSLINDTDIIETVEDYQSALKKYSL